MIPKEIDKITEQDLQELIDNSVAEGKTMEYKQALPENSDSGKKEFLADISSFANASGGDMIFGITENRDTGMPKELKGIDIENDDKEIIRIENIIRDGLEPRISLITIMPIVLSNSKSVLIIRIPKSWLSPHRIIFKGSDKFYSRSSKGKYPLDVGELRTAFNLSETVSERIRKFREERIARIYANETPVPFYDNAKMVLHLLPLSSFSTSQQYDIEKIYSKRVKMSPINSSGGNSRYTLEGVLNYEDSQEGKVRSYVQFYRNGIIEAVEGYMLRPCEENKFFIPSIAYEKELITGLSIYLKIMQEMKIEPPIFVFLSLVGVKDYYMAVNRYRFGSDGGNSINRDVLVLPEIVIENYDGKAQDILRPCFNTVWNTCGFSKSLNYNKAGEWGDR